MLQKMYSKATMVIETAPLSFNVGIGFLISFASPKALAYPLYANRTLTRATDRSLPLFVVPSNELRKLRPGSATRGTCPPRTTNPVILML